ncbi:hypothetical protein [Psychromonas sp. Urea-02u-13]|uniref:hypothetical protein n=1 Tax=Psychromonas sp. Urea-02u-13 TaxID=2058326 RepID=UPI000C33A357|nr:hypothetical protein [Psychromonas sp. Urea-02u-13]PKG40285.1 hypothetical protein CXF74_04250 [Psychromonas sp. Urea-02u-13]
MDSLSLFIKNAPAPQLFTFAAAIAVWIIGGYFLKKTLLKRLASQNGVLNENVQLEDIKFEDIQKKEWRIFAMLAFAFVGLVLLAFYIPDLLS